MIKASSNGQTPPGDLIASLEADVYPKLDAKTVYSHVAHQWKEELSDKIKGGCPWHDSKSGTSFYVYTKTLLWYCPGCGIGGGPIQYRWRLRGCGGSPRGDDFITVVKELFDLAGVPFPDFALSRDAHRRGQRRETRRAILEVVETHCHERLLLPGNQAARDYLLTRGFDENAIRELRLGLYPSCTELMRGLRSKGFTDEEMRESGIVFKRMEQYIVFPWRDDRGAPLTLYGTWCGRTPPEGKPKKMALPNPTDDGEVEEKTKRSPLYLNRVLHAGCSSVYLLEGVTDAALAQVKGDAAAIACVAAQLSRDQVETLQRRGIRSVTICLDPDSAGDNGIISCIRQLRAADIAVYVAARLPEGMDPDDFILAHGIDAWHEHLRHACHAFRWQAKVILAAHGHPETDADAEALARAAGDYAKTQPASATEELTRYFWPEIAAAIGADPIALMARFGTADGRGSFTPGHQDENTGSAPDCGDWPDPQPIPNDLPPVLPFDPTMLLPESFVGFVRDVAERMQCPVDFPAVALMIVLASVLGTKLGIRPKRHDDWHVVANLWGAVVGRPGVMKTPAIRVPIRFLQRLEGEAGERHAEALAEYELAAEVYKAKKEERKKAIAKATKAKDDATAAAKEFELGEEPQEPEPGRYLVNDSSVEKLGELLNANPNGLMLFRDELVGMLKSLDKEGHEGARAFYLEAWDGGGSFTYDRIGRGTVHIPCATLSLLGGITPGALLDYLRGAIQGGSGDDGLMQRHQLLIYPDIDKNWRNVDRWPDTEARRRVWAVIDRLDKVDPAAVPEVFHDRDHDRYFLRFDDPAQQLFDDWRTRLEQRVRSGEDHPAIESHLAKYRSLIPTLALLLHLADHDGGPVEVTAMRKALVWADYLESHMRRVYSLGINTASIAAKALGQRILDGDLKDGFRARDVYRKCWTGLSDSQAVNQALDMLLELHWLREEEEQPEAGGRKTLCYRLNPKLGAKRAPSPTDKTDKTGAEEGFVSSGSEPPGHFAHASPAEEGFVSSGSAPFPSFSHANGEAGGGDDREDTPAPSPDVNGAEAEVF